MEIVLEGLVSTELVKAAAEGRIYPHVVCGVDVYRRSEIAVEDGVEIDKSIPLTVGIMNSPGMFFSGRHYRVIHLLDPDEYDPQSTIAEIKERMKQLKAKGTGFLCDDVLEQDDGDTAYVLTPLYDSEFDELMEH